MKKSYALMFFGLVFGLQVSARDVFVINNSSSQISVKGPVSAGEVESTFPVTVKPGEMLKVQPSAAASETLNLVVMNPSGVMKEHARKYPKDSVIEIADETNPAKQPGFKLYAADNFSEGSLSNPRRK